MRNDRHEYGLNGAAGDLLKDLGRAFVADAKGMLQEVSIESSLLPTIRVDLRKKNDGGGPSTSVGGKTKKGGFLKLVQPRVMVRTSYGDMEVAPAGRPASPGRLYPVVLGAGTGVVALATLGVVSLATSGRRGLAGIVAIATGSYLIYRWQKSQIVTR